MRLYIKKLDNFNYELVNYNNLKNIFSQNGIKFCYINRDFADNLFLPFEDKIIVPSDNDKNSKNNNNYKKFFGIINFSNFEKRILEFVLFKVDNNEKEYFFNNNTNNIRVEELENHIKSICLLKIRNNCVVYGSLTADKSASKNIDIFISKMYNKEIISDHIANFNILEQIKKNGVSKIDFNIISNKNYDMKKENTFTNLIKALSNNICNAGKNRSDKKNDLKLKISITTENKKNKEGYNNLEKLKFEAIKLINEDDLENNYTIYLQNGSKIESSELILSKSINVSKKADFKDVAKNIFAEMDIFFNEKLEDINEVLHNS